MTTILQTSLVALLTLTFLEIILGIDNIIFISILVSRLPQKQQAKIRNLGLFLALGMRLLLLFSLSFLIKLKEPLFIISDHGFSGRDLILLLGGLFLIGKSTHEIYHKVEILETAPLQESKNPGHKQSLNTLIQIVIIDIVFSLDSVITALGMAQELWIMVLAMIISVLVMLFTARSISQFVDTHPSLKILALSFLLLIGVLLVADGMGTHLDKGYVYFAMSFSLGVEFLNMRFNKKASLKKRL